ncbi:helix-turn-helix transcriptional regulator [Myxacorys almedinensis]|uniref:WYL domain-containing protein n=1 Tax=Myxacorys almedinensis A TaxID=2690445 RepID=A0A8J7Z527_9CYAN|nr:WYL domain-containing protein [Myxacorys almedinensis]NDJ17981.1 WYL domain-containing protein [Myxacorys almedinensis A]
MHPYSEFKAFTRLLLLITTFVQYPGVGSPDPFVEEDDHDAMEAVLTRMKTISETLGIEFLDCSVHTLRKDLKTLRQYGILDQRMYRWGYYLGTGALDRAELQAAWQALQIQAEAQGDPQIRQVVKQLEQRLRGLNLELQGELFYPVRSQSHQVILYTDPDELRQRGIYERETLFECLEDLESAIVQGQAVEIYHARDPYHQKPRGFLQVYPLQLLYHDIAWYLVYEETETGQFVTMRVDRLAAQCRRLEMAPRGTAIQLQQLRRVEQLLRDGWGINLGEREEQQQELSGQPTAVKVKVRFFERVVPFIVEGNRRHPKQTLQVVKNGAGQVEAVDYAVVLPRRSLEEFFRWVNRFLEQAQVLAPVEWVEKYAVRSQQMMERYSQRGSGK